MLPLADEIIFVNKIVVFELNLI